jgi:hypothetical protein
VISDKLGSNFFIVIPTKKFFCLRRFVNEQLCLFELFWHILVRPTTNLYFRQKHLNILQCLWSRMQIRIPISHKASFYSLLIYLPSFAEQFTTNLLLNFFYLSKIFFGSFVSHSLLEFGGPLLWTGLFGNLLHSGLPSASFISNSRICKKKKIWINVWN